MLSQAIGEAAKANRGPEVDGKASILRCVLGEEALEGLLHAGLAQALSQLLEAQVFGNLLEKNLHKDAR